jgi:hypothetical protein
MKKLLIIIFVGIWLTIGAGVLITLMVPQLVIAPFINYKFSEEKVPKAHIVPVQRTVISPNTDLSDYPKYSYYGLEFQIPWKKIIKREEKKGAVLLRSSDTQSIVIFDPQTVPVPRELLLGNDPNNAKRVKDFFGEEVMQSNYAFYNNILLITPKDITLTTPGKEAVAKSVLVALKPLLIVTPGGETTVYSFTTNEIRGFQFGRPTGKGSVVITLFDEEDKMYEMVIKCTNQEDIDFILSTIKTK